MAFPHIGSWGTPEFGFSEYLSNLFGQGRTAQGGSNLMGNQAGTTLVPASGSPMTFVPSGSAGAYGVQGGNYLQPAPRVGAWGPGSTVAPMPSSQQSSQPGDDELTALLKIGPNLNPAQRTRLGQLLSSQQQAGPSQADLDAIYQPGMETLAEQEKLLGQERGAAERTIGNEWQAGLSLIDKNLSEQEAKLARQATTINTQRANALLQARQLYGELAQRYGAQFGSRSSAGPFAMEILGRETQRQFGNVEEGATRALGDVESEKRRLTDFTNQQRMDWQAKKALAIGDVQANFQRGIAQINASRNQLETARAQNRFDLLQQAKAHTQQIAAMDKQFSQNLAMFEQQKLAQLQQMQYARQLEGLNVQPFQPNVVGAARPQNATTFTPTGYQNGMVWDPINNTWVWPK